MDRFFKVTENKIINMDHIEQMELIEGGRRPQIKIRMQFSTTTVNLDQASPELLEEINKWNLVDTKKPYTSGLTPKETVWLQQLRDQVRQLFSKK